MSSSGCSGIGAMTGLSVPVRLTVGVVVGVPATTWTSKVTACMSSAVVRAVGADAVEVQGICYKRIAHASRLAAPVQPLERGAR